MVNSDIALARPAVMLESVPFLITVHIISVLPISSSSPWCWILDATPEEQAVAVTAVHVAVMPRDKSQSVVMAVWKSGSGSVPLHLLPTVVQTAVDAVETAQQSNRVVGANNDRPQAADCSRQWLEGPLLIQ
jgi:exosome complex RNA-binding protein Rrp42 (RNase PH superfamily)